MKTGVRYTLFLYDLDSVTDFCNILYCVTKFCNILQGVTIFRNIYMVLLPGSAMLSEKEREFIRDYIADGGGCSDEFREKWNYDYERVLWHRIMKKYPKILRDLFLLEEILSRYAKSELFFEYMTSEKTRGEEEEAQKLISFLKHVENKAV